LIFNRFSFQKIELRTPKNQITLNKTELGHWVNPQDKPVTIPLHNLFKELESLRPTQTVSTKGVFLFDLKISSGNYTESFQFNQISDNSFRVDSKETGVRLWLTGDIEEVLRQLLKLTVPE
jgi:hypothetical protein